MVFERPPEEISTVTLKCDATYDNELQIVDNSLSEST